MSNFEAFSHMQVTKLTYTTAADCRQYQKSYNC